MQTTTIFRRIFTHWAHPGQNFSWRSGLHFLALISSISKVLSISVLNMCENGQFKQTSEPRRSNTFAWTSWTRWYPWGIQRLVSTYSNWNHVYSSLIPGGGMFWNRSNLNSEDLPKFLFGGGVVFWKVKTQSAKICLNFYGGGVCSEPNSRLGCSNSKFPTIQILYFPQYKSMRRTISNVDPESSRQR